MAQAAKHSPSTAGNKRSRARPSTGFTRCPSKWNTRNQANPFTSCAPCSSSPRAIRAQRGIAKVRPDQAGEEDGDEGCAARTSKILRVYADRTGHQRLADGADPGERVRLPACLLFEPEPD